MRKCKITVLKRHFDEELAKEYGAKGLDKCPMLSYKITSQVYRHDWLKALKQMQKKLKAGDNDDD